jgi:hypothetical protein
MWVKTSKGFLKIPWGTAQPEHKPAKNIDKAAKRAI